MNNKQINLRSSENLNKKEIELIDNLIDFSIKKGRLISEEELNKVLLE